MYEGACRVFNCKVVKQAIVTGLTGLILLAVLVWIAFYDLTHDQLKSVHIGCENSEIQMKWELPLFNQVSGVKITIEGKNTNEEVVLSSWVRHYEFNTGKHGEKYKVTIKALYRNGTEGDPYVQDLLYFEDDKLPQLPIIRIETVNYEEPTHEVLSSPYGVGNSTVISNDYVEGVMNFALDDTTSINSRMRIKIRGNSSSVYSEKKSYKIQLDDPIDLLRMGNEYADKEWILLNSGTSLNNHIGEYFSDYFNMDWTAHMMMVNVVVNGDWKGLYYLAENVKQSNSAGRISDSGFIIENDPYWWTPNNVSFQLDALAWGFRYSVIYPANVSSDDNHIEDIRDFMTVIHRNIDREEDDALEYINVHSFVSWIMVKDIMLIYDSAGSNMYYYMYSLDPDDYSENELFIGPLWDFDSGMVRSYSNPATDWSNPHSLEDYIFSQLFEIESFRREYAEQWNIISDDLYEDFRDELERLYLEQGEDIEASRELDAIRWNKKPYQLRDEIDSDEAFIIQRIEFIDSSIEEW